MFVVKRSGEHEPVSFDRITDRITAQADGLKVDVGDVTKRVVAGVHCGMLTSAIDEYACEVLAALITAHPDYGVLASRIAVSNLHKRTSDSFSYTETELLNENREIVEIIHEHRQRLDTVIRHENDYKIPYFGLKTLENNYLLRHENGNIAERPQYMFMRTALEIHRRDIEAVVETYELMSNMKGIHATPTLMNACVSRQLASCYLVTPGANEVDELFDKLSKCATISDRAGGIGINLSHMRIHNCSVIYIMKLVNDIVRVVSHHGKRRSAIAIYLEPWHADINDFLEAKLPTAGSEDTKCRDVFMGLWIPDLFMERVERGEHWTLFDPKKCPGLSDVWGDDFVKLYERYEREGKGRKVRALDVWRAMLRSHTETGGPYILFKDACNRKSNQSNLGTIKCSNLCSEIIEYTSEDEIAVCNLASISLPANVLDDGTYDYAELARVTKILTRNLNKVVDNMIYPVPEAKTSNEKHRPIGIGIQGLADVFVKLKLPFDSPEARAINKNIAETMYFAALDASCELAERYEPYSSYEGSPASKGLLQHDLWGVPDTPRHDWPALRARIREHGLRNSLLIALMPTASTAQILGNNESFEPFTNNVFTRRVSCGTFQIVNNSLVDELNDMGMWNEETKNTILEDDGSVKNLDIPEEMKRVFRTVWEIPQRSLIDMAADRGPYVDQSQSMSLFLPEPTNSNMSSMHFYAWRQGLKTGLYYLRTRPGATATKFTVQKKKKAAAVCKKRKEKEDDLLICEACSA